MYTQGVISPSWTTSPSLFVAVKQQARPSLGVGTMERMAEDLELFGNEWVLRETTCFVWCVIAEVIPEIQAR